MRAQNNVFLISDRARQRRAQGFDVVDGTVGMMLDSQGDLVRLPAMTAALKQSSDLPLEYPPVGGYASYLEAALKWVFRELTPRVASATALMQFATLGGSGALYMAFAYARKLGYEILHPDIGWPNYLTITRAALAPMRAYRLFDESGHLDLESIRAIMEADRTRFRGFLILLNDPCHNPTGYTMSPVECQRAYDLARRIAPRLNTRADILWDAAYLDFASARPDWLRGALEPAGESRTFIAFSASKSFGAYGLRTGALFGLFPPHQRKEVEEMTAYLQAQTYGTYSTPVSLSERAVELVMTADAASGVDGQIAAWKGAVDQRAQRLIAALKREGIGYLPYTEGFYLVVKSPVDADDVEDELERRDVFLSPVGSNLVRVSLASIREEDGPRIARALSEAFATLEEKA